MRRSLTLLGALVVALSGPAVRVAPRPAGAATRLQINGSGSSWAANAINQWVADVYTEGVQVSFNPDGDAQGRQDFANKVSDFAVTADGFQGFDPTTGSLGHVRRPPLRLPAGRGRWHLVPLPDQVRRHSRSRTCASRARPWPRSSPTRSPTGTTPRSPRTTTVSQLPSHPDHPGGPVRGLGRHAAADRLLRHRVPEHLDSFAGQSGRPNTSPAKATRSPRTARPGR